MMVIRKESVVEGKIDLAVSSVDRFRKTLGEGFSDPILEFEFVLKLKALSTQLVALISTIDDYALPVRRGSLKVELQRLEKFWIQQALEDAGGSQIKAAALLGTKPTTLNAKIKQYGLLTRSSL